MFFETRCTYILHTLCCKCGSDQQNSTYRCVYSRSWPEAVQDTYIVNFVRWAVSAVNTLRCCLTISTTTFALKTCRDSLRRPKPSATSRMKCSTISNNLKYSSSVPPVCCHLQCCIVDTVSGTWWNLIAWTIQPERTLWSTNKHCYFLYHDGTFFVG